LKEHIETISYDGDRSTAFAVVLSKLRRLQIRVDLPWHSGHMSDAAKLQLGFDLDYGTTQASPKKLGGQ